MGGPIMSQVSSLPSTLAQHLEKIRALKALSRDAPVRDPLTAISAAAPQAKNIDQASQD
jgi:hypothetical protein